MLFKEWLHPGFQFYKLIFFRSRTTCLTKKTEEQQNQVQVLSRYPNSPICSCFSLSAAYKYKLQWEVVQALIIAKAFGSKLWSSSSGSLFPHSTGIGSKGSTAVLPHSLCCKGHSLAFLNVIFILSHYWAALTDTLPVMKLLRAFHLACNFKWPTLWLLMKTISSLKMTDMQS